MFEWAPGIPILDDMTRNEEIWYDKGNPEYELVKEIVEDIYEEKDMDKGSNEGFLISYESDINDPDGDTEVESIISTPEVEIVNDNKSVKSIRKDQEAEMFP